MSCLKHLHPAEVFTCFEDICKIPHGSGNTKAIGDYIESRAISGKLAYTRDESGNIIIKKPASPGYEDAPAVMLQGHMDMVNEKTLQSTHDFTSDPLDLFVDGDWIGARDTTLGGDNGIAVAYMLAILADDSLAHPALECVFTVDEEVGLLGASDIDLSDSKAAYLINLDSEAEGILTVSCAGGVRVDLTLPLTWEKASGNAYELVIDHCLGGHSGADIDKGRCNPLLLAGRLLFELSETRDVRIASLDGGLKDNAIPRSVRMTVTADCEAEEFAAAVNALFDGYRKEYAVSDPDMTLTVFPAGASRVMSRVSQGKVLFLLRMMPNGVQAMSQNIPGLVETSLNSGIMETGEENFLLSGSIRSSVNSRKEEMAQKVMFLVEYLGGEASLRGDYPGWEYRQDSLLRDRMARIWQELTGKPAKIEAIHAGLECGLLSEKRPGLDIVSIGPDMRDIHTPNERLSISSSERCYRYLLEVLKRMKG